MNDREKLLHCSFCGLSQHQVRKLIAGPSVFICDGCVDVVHRLRTGSSVEEAKGISEVTKDETQHCSFCGKQTRKVKQLYQHDDVHVCNECIDLCDDIIREESAQPAKKKYDASAAPGLVAQMITNALMDDAEILSLSHEPGAANIEVSHVKKGQHKVVSQPPATLFYEMLVQIMTMRQPGYEPSAGEIRFDYLGKSFVFDLQIDSDKDGTHVVLILQSGQPEAV